MVVLAVERAVVLAVERAGTALAVALAAAVLAAAFDAAFAVVDLAVVAREAVDFATVDFAAVDFAAADLVAVDLVAAGLAAVVLAGVRVEAALVGGAFLADAFLAGAFLLLSTVLTAVEGWNFTPLEAAILTSAPFCGLRPFRALRAVGLKVPKPKIETFSPDRAAVTTDSVNALTAASACLRSRPAAEATASTSSDLFTPPPGAWGRRL